MGNLYSGCASKQRILEELKGYELEQLPGPFPLSVEDMAPEIKNHFQGSRFQTPGC